MGTLSAIEEIQRRAAANAAAARASAESAPKVHNDGALAPIKHPQQDFFLAQIFDAPLKDDQASMEHPMFSLSKSPDLRIRVYEHNGNTVTITPSAAGESQSGAAHHANQGLAVPSSTQETLLAPRRE
jgi:hypothetical protein